MPRKQQQNRSIRNYATDYAQLYNIDPQREDEEAWAFRLRVAREIERRGKPVHAHEALHNRGDDGHFWFRLNLDNGYGEEYLRMEAKKAESAYMEALRVQYKHERGKHYLFRFWKRQS